MIHTNKLKHAAYQMQGGYKIYKKDLYKLLIDEVENERYKKNCEFFNREFKIKDK